MGLMLLEQCFEITSAIDLEDFRKRLVANAEDLGFGLVSSALATQDPLHPSEQIYHVVSNTPKAFLDASFDQAMMKRDPVVKRMQSSPLPFWYDQALYVREAVGELWEEQAAFGYQTGIVLRLPMPGNQHFLLGVDREEPLPKDEGRLLRIVADLQYLATHAQAGASRLLLPTRTPVVALSLKEKEVLRWIREGKSNWVIGQILSVTEQQVRYVVRSVCRKLDATSKQQALVKAADLNLL